MADPSRTVIIPWELRRKLYRAGCRKMPCASAMRLDPVCAVCAVEGEITRARRNGLKQLERKT